MMLLSMVAVAVPQSSTVGRDCLIHDDAKGLKFSIKLSLR
jgi:hypothetical protein